MHLSLVYHLEQATMHNAILCHDMQQDCVLAGQRHLDEPDSQCMASPRLNCHVCYSTDSVHTHSQCPLPLTDCAWAKQPHLNEPTCQCSFAQRSPA